MSNMKVGTFNWALKQLEKGYKIRRKDWGDGICWYPMFGGANRVGVRFSENMFGACSISHFTATDWETVGEPKPNPYNTGKCQSCSEEYQLGYSRAEYALHFCSMRCRKKFNGRARRRRFYERHGR